MATKGKTSTDEILRYCFIPFTGIFGVHDFKRGKKLLGWLHILAFAPTVCVFVYFVWALSNGYRFGPGPIGALVVALLASFLGTFPIIALNYVFAVVEGIIIMKNRKTPSGKSGQNGIKLKSYDSKDIIFAWCAVLIPYELLCVLCYLVKQRAKNDEVCLALNCYSMSSVYSFATVIMLICTLVAIYRIGNAKSVSFWVFVVILVICVAHCFYSLRGVNFMFL